MDLSKIAGLDTVIAGIIVNILLALLSAFGAYAVAWLRKHVSQQNLSTAISVAMMAVKAAESVGTAYGYDSKAKFEYAINSARKMGESSGIKFTDDQWEAFIEQAHHQLVVLAQELEPGPTVDAHTTPHPEPAGPPGPQTEEGQELTGIGDRTPDVENETPVAFVTTPNDDTPLEDRHGAFLRDERG